MDSREAFDAFLTYIKNTFPDVVVVTRTTDEIVKELEENYYPSLMQILQKDAKFFDVDRYFCGVNLTECWNTSDEFQETCWKNLQICLFASFLHGDIKEKIGTIVATMKNMWNNSGNENDEVTRLLNDEASEDHIKEIFEYISNTRISKVFTEIAEQFDISDLNLNFENPQEIIETLKNPEHPAMKKVITKIQTLVKEKIQRGEFSQQMLMSEVEGIKAKITSLFGNIFNEALGGRRSEVAPSVLMGNSPEARKQRMLARLQKKQRDRK
jgi:hypothetical protein